jgi:hypothetical protein
MEVRITKVSETYVELIRDDGRGHNACTWTKRCPVIRNIPTTCPECPAITNNSKEMMTHEEAVKWWEAQ